MKKIILIASLMGLTSAFAEVDLKNPNEEEIELIKICKVEIMYAAQPPKLQDCVNQKAERKYAAPIKKEKKK